MSTTQAPIAIFTYNRPIHTKRTIDSLLLNQGARHCELYLFSDGAKNTLDAEKVGEVRTLLKTISGFKKIYLHLEKENKGLANSIIDGVSAVLKNHEKVIVLEDDLETSNHFLKYMNDALNYYSPLNVWSIAGYSPSIKIPNDYTKSTYLIHRNCSWGWATWKQNWEKTDWDIHNFSSFFNNKAKRTQFERGGNDLSVMLLKQQQQKIQSWSVRFNYAAFEHNLPTVYPIHSMVNNLGVDGSGTHMKQSQKYSSTLMLNKLNNEEFCAINNNNRKIEIEFKKFYNTSLYRYIINWFKIRKAIIGLK